MFCSQELAARIESSTTGLLLACARSFAARHPDGDVLVRELGGGAAAWLAPHSPFNKVAGLGFASPPSDEQPAAL